MDPNFDLTGPLDPVALTGSDKPFAMFPDAAERFRKAGSDIAALFRSRTLEATNIHMGKIDFEREATGIAGAAALVTPGIQAVGRLFIEPENRKGIMPADPKFAETPFIKAAETLTKKVYDENRPATPEEKKQAAALLLLGIRYLDEKSPGADGLLPMLVGFLKDQGYQLGSNLPDSMRTDMHSRSTGKKTGVAGSFTASVRETAGAIHNLAASHRANADAQLATAEANKAVANARIKSIAAQQALTAQLARLNTYLESRRPKTVTAATPALQKTKPD